MNYCKNCYKNKEQPLTLKFLDCVKFTSRNRICLNYKKIQELKNKNTMSPTSKELNEKDLFTYKRTKIDNHFSFENKENKKSIDNHSERFNSPKYHSEKIDSQNNQSLTSVNKQNLLTIDLNKIPSLKHITHIKSKVKYIENYIVQFLLKLDKDFEEFNIDVVHMVNELVDT